MVAVRSNRDAEKISEHHPLNWSDKVTGDFVRTIFPHQTAYIQFTATAARLPVSYSNQIIKSESRYETPTRDIDIEFSWHSGQVCRMQLPVTRGAPRETQYSPMLGLNP